MIVSDDANRNPVGLLFAGSSTQTIANRIDLVLNRFGVRVDVGEPPPPPPPPPPPTPGTDVEVTSVSAPGSATAGSTVTVAVTVRNVGTQDVSAGFAVTLKDTTDNVLIGTQTVAGLSAGASATLSFGWNTGGSSTGSHTLIARHDVADDNASNDFGVTTVTVNVPIGIHVGDLDGFSSNDGSSWSATVEITVHDANHNPVNGATVTGSWNLSGLNSNTCTTGDLGGTGTCIVLFPGLPKKTRTVILTIRNVTMAGQPYRATANHDVDGSSNGTWINVNKP